MFSSTDTGPIEEVKERLKEILKDNPPQPERGIREKTDGILDRLKTTYGPDWNINFSLTGGDDGALNLSITPVV